MKQNSEHFHCQTMNYLEDIKQQRKSVVYSQSIFKQTFANKTIEADVISNRIFMYNKFRVTMMLVIMAVLLKLMPSPIIITVVQNDATVFSKFCEVDDCEKVDEGYEIITIKKINPLHRQLKYLVRVSEEQKTNIFKLIDKKQMNIEEQIKWIQIYAARDNQIYGEAVYQRSGKEVYQVFFQQRPFVFVGEVHLLSEASYILKIYKRAWPYNTTVRIPDRLLQDLSQNTENMTLIDANLQIAGAYQINDSLNISFNQQVEYQTFNFTNQSSRVQQDNSSAQNISNYAENTNKTVQVFNENKSQNISQSEILTNISQIQQISKNKSHIQIIENYVSVPLTVQIVRYSQFFTGVELLIRYITFLYILYVRADTIQSPFIFHLILLLTANPLIFIEITFPNIAGDILSTTCSSAYIFYLGIWLDYTHKQLSDSRVDFLVRILKMLGVLVLYFVNLFRQLHLLNQTTVYLILYVLIILVFIPLVEYLWDLYFFKDKTTTHRDVLLVVLTIYYFILLMFNSYLVEYGWRKITFYLIILVYGVKLCYLTRPLHKTTKDQNKDIVRSVDKEQTKISRKGHNNQTEQNLDAQTFHESIEQRLQVLDRVLL